MIKEHIKTLDNLRPEGIRFPFNPLNRNLCFSGGSYTGGEGNIVDEFMGMFDSMGRSLTGGGSSGGGVETAGGLGEEDLAMKKKLYDQLQTYLGQEYEGYDQPRFADRSPEELALLKQAQEGHPMFDKASEDLGFASDIYKTGTGYGVEQLDKDASDLLAGDTYRNEVRDQILRDMNRGASMSGMRLNDQAVFSGAGGTHDRGGTSGTERLLSNQNYLSQAGDALTKLNFGAYQDALNRARQLNLDRQTSAGMFGQTALQNLGIGRDKFGSQLGAFRDERGDRQRDLDWEYKNWLDEKNFLGKKLGFGSSIFSCMPFEQKVISQQPASGGK